MASCEITRELWSSERLESIKRSLWKAAEVDPMWVDRMLFHYDWPNYEEHAAWRDTAEVDEITGWLRDLWENEQAVIDA